MKNESTKFIKNNIVTFIDKCKMINSIINPKYN